jgi:hypothetical protein
MMSLKWKLRILVGPMRPFLLSKASEVVRHILDRARYAARSGVVVHEGLHTMQGLMPLPSPEWFRENSAKVLEFARSMRQGRVRAYGIGVWSVGDDDPSDVDVRSVHELSRMHHWCAYALAAHIEPEHADDWAQQFEHEISAFTASYGPSSVHWKFPMGNAIRVFSMLVAWDWLRRSGYENVETDRYVAARAIEHGRSVYLERESRGGLSTSHYAANLLGLFAVELYVQGASLAPKMREWLVAEFHRELPRQILWDGMTQEASTGYHRHVVDIYVMMAMLMKGAKLTLDHRATERLSQSLTALRQLEAVGFPLIGDNDDGMALKLTGFAPSTSATFDLASMIGISAGTATDRCSFPEFGLDVWNGPLAVTLRNGSVGQFGKGGHAHHDQNSITVTVDGRPFIIDPGTTLYTRSESVRNQQRSVHQHATMWAPDVEQGHTQPGYEGLFWLPGFDRMTDVRGRSATGWMGEVIHRSGLRHTREVEIDQLSWTIMCKDLLESRSGAVSGQLVLPLAPDVTVAFIEQGALLTSTDVRVQLTWRGATAALQDITIAPTFGASVPSKAIALSGNSIIWVLSRS